MHRPAHHAALLALLVLALIPARPGVGAQDAPAALAWHLTPVSLPAQYQALCFDTAHPHTILLAEKGAGTFAYDWASGARTLVNTRPFDLCAASGWLYAGDPAGGSAWRFSSSDPAGRSIDHMPTVAAQDGSAQVYALPGADSGPFTSFWASSDGGLTWVVRGQGLGGPIGSVVMAQADARAIYALLTTRYGTTCDYSRNPSIEAGIDYTLAFSPDAGATWQTRAGGRLPAPEGAAFADIRIAPLPGAAIPVNMLVRTVRFRSCASYSSYRQIDVSADGGQSWHEVFHESGDTSYSGIQLLHTAAGVLCFSYAPANQPVGANWRRSLDLARDGTPPWTAVPYPGLAAPQYFPEVALAVAPAGPNTVLLSSEHTTQYSADGGRSWQELGHFDAVYASPYRPLTLIGVRDTRLYVLDLPDGGSLTAPAALSGAPDSMFLAATGHNLAGRFKDYWQAHGDLAQQGYPISEAALEVSPLDGRTYLTQYFERAVFEYHPEQSAPNSVLLSLLGTFGFQRRYGTGGASGQHPSTANPRFFPQTGHTLGGKFRAYWESHGGLAQQGYPLSDEFTEISALDGQPHTVQYFERAVFELHPEASAPLAGNAGTPYEVLLGQLGTFQAQEVAGSIRLPRVISRAETLRGIAMVAPDEGWAVGGSIVRYADGTTSPGGLFLHYTAGRWTPQPLPALVDRNLTGISMVAPNLGCAVGDRVSLQDIFGQWLDNANGMPASPAAVDMISPDEGWAVGGEGGAGYIRHYAYAMWGLEWPGAPPSGPAVPAGPPLNGLAMLPSGAGWAVGAAGRILRRSGGTWTAVPSPTAAGLRSVSWTPAGDAWAVGDRGTILHYTGDRWSVGDSPVSTDLNRVRMVTATEGWAVGAHGTILHYSAGAWWPLPSPTAADLYDLAFTTTGDAWAVGDQGTILHYRNGTWTLEGTGQQ